MATTHHAVLKVALYSTLLGSGDLDATQSIVSKIFSKHFTTGTGADQSNAVWSDSGTATGAATSLDLAGGSLTNRFNEALTFTKLKGIFVIASASNTTNLEVVMPANGVPWCLTAADAVLLCPGGCLLWTAPDANGVTVTAGTGDLLNLHATSGSCAYDIIIWGTV